MNMEKFKPMLAIDATHDLDKIKYPKYASKKFDGIRCIMHPEKGMISRSLKQIQNKQLQEKFAEIKEYSKDNNILLDGELYSHDLTFQEITRVVMTQDFDDEKTKKKIMKEEEIKNDLEYLDYTDNLLNSINFHCFDILTNKSEDIPFELRLSAYQMLRYPHVIPVNQKIVKNAEEVRELFKTALDDGFEGLILRDFNSPYKFGRSTLKEEYLLKVKPFETFDGKIIEVIQATEVDPEAEKKINELGHSVTSKKKDDRILIEKASAFKVMYVEEVVGLQGEPQEQYGHEVKVTIAMTDEEKKEIWKNRDEYIGKWIEYKGMTIGSKDCPRHPVMIRFREAKE